MNIIQNFYDSLAARYDRLFQDWDEEVKDQARILDRLFGEFGLERGARVLDCACGIGTQAIGLAGLGYQVTASDISEKELAEVRKRAAERGASIRFAHADFRALSGTFPGTFDLVMAMDNALPHMLTREDLEAAVRSMTGRARPGGLLAVSIRDYDRLLEDRPPYSPPYIHKTEAGQRVSFQTWDWEGDIYRLTQYIIEDEKALQVSRFECAYRAVRRQELTELLRESGCREVWWKFPEETGFYQPVVIARK